MAKTVSKFAMFCALAETRAFLYRHLEIDDYETAIFPLLVFAERHGIDEKRTNNIIAQCFEGLER